MSIDVFAYLSPVFESRLLPSPLFPTPSHSTPSPSSSSISPSIPPTASTRSKSTHPPQCTQSHSTSTATTTTAKKARELSRFKTGTTLAHFFVRLQAQTMSRRSKSSSSRCRPSMKSIVSNSGFAPVQTYSFICLLYIQASLTRRTHNARPEMPTTFPAPLIPPLKQRGGW